MKKDIYKLSFQNWGGESTEIEKLWMANINENILGLSASSYRISHYQNPEDIQRNVWTSGSSLTNVIKHAEPDN